MYGRPAGGQSTGGRGCLTGVRRHPTLVDHLVAVGARPLPGPREPVKRTPPLLTKAPRRIIVLMQNWAGTVQDGVLLADHRGADHIREVRIGAALCSELGCHLFACELVAGGQCMLNRIDERLAGMPWLRVGLQPRL